MTPSILRWLADSKRRIVVFLFIFSLLVRLSLLIPLGDNNIRIRFDENVYFSSACGFYSVFQDLIKFTPPKHKDLRDIYAGGVAPPFHSFLLALGFLIFGKSVFAARMIVAILSALTTPLVFLLTASISSRKAGMAASLIHVFYPSFVVFSHFLWSETTYIFFLLLSVYLTLLVIETVSPKKRIWYSLGLGVVLGVMTLIRAATIVFLILIPLWILINKKKTRDRILVPLIIIIIFSAIIAPWEFALVKHQKRFVFLSTYSGRNLYYGNNKWLRDPREFSPHEPDLRPRDDLRKYARENKIHIEQAARVLALKEITSHFGAFIQRTFNRFLKLWTFDFFPFRHLVNGAYRPLPPVWAIIVFFIFGLSHIFLMLFVILGFLVKELSLKIKTFFLILVLAGIAPYILSVANTRYNLPQVALLVPIAGSALIHFRYKKKKMLSILVPLVTAFCFIGTYFYTYHNFIYRLLRPSSYYHQPMDFLDGIFKTESYFTDVIKVRTKSSEPVRVFTLKILNSNHYSFEPSKHVRKKRIRLSFEPKTIKIYSKQPPELLLLSVSSRIQKKAIELKPTSPEYWIEFKSLGLAGLELKWLGGD